MLSVKLAPKSDESQALEFGFLRDEQSVLVSCDICRNERKLKLTKFWFSVTEIDLIVISLSGGMPLAAASGLPAPSSATTVESRPSVT